MLFDDDPFPERDPVFDIGRRFFWLGIIPGSIFVHFTTDQDVVITRFAFPRTGGVLVASLEILPVDRIDRK